MTRDEIAKMAHEAGLANVRMSAGLESMRTDMWVRFAALVAAAEREACAKVCSEEAKDWAYPSHGNAAATMCVMRIRARNQPPKSGD